MADLGRRHLNPARRSLVVTTSSSAAPPELTLTTAEVAVHIICYTFLRLHHTSTQAAVPAPLTHRLAQMMSPPLANRAREALQPPSLRPHRLQAARSGGGEAGEGRKGWVMAA